LNEGRDSVIVKPDVSQATSNYVSILASWSGNRRAIFPMFCNKCGTNLGGTLERFPNVQAINIGTLDNPDDVEVTIEMFSDEALSCVAHKSTHTVYHRHRLNEDGSAAKPKIID